jgi:hypothetical protein
MLFSNANYQATINPEFLLLCEMPCIRMKLETLKLEIRRLPTAHEVLLSDCDGLTKADSPIGC